MEWSKIKTMFIYLFLILNIILLMAYIYTIKLNNTEFYQEKDAIIKSIKNDDIDIIEPQIKKDSLSYISGSIHDFKEPIIKIENYSYELINTNSGRKLFIRFDTPIANINNNNYRDVLNLFITEKLDKGFSYSFDNYSDKTKMITYRQTVDNLKIYDNINALIEFKVDENGDIKSMVQSGLVDIKKDISENIATYNQVIYKLYHENYIPKNSRVVSSLGYYTSASQILNQVLIPVWKIEVNYLGDKQYYYVDAINIKILEKNNE
ncbi:two-component system regulatory protein YycI [Gemelliphila palaticanis]|uniref:Two-component system regulatory protein YycI n=1 Tax=Gemelliphila palaticanis TaxID=81950 RepID=A0ABX2T101_9BACL|nr:two-component system regulatory protein YycI [Gemella palaticanis]MBF0716152.1 two-component system regulatory protein YycI [Gemella palaticanis]NYS48082.1 two-component system regulatory protein YycI [Gemella palaticanis]